MRPAPAGWMCARGAGRPQMLAATDPERDLADCLPPLVEADASFAIAPAIAEELGLPRRRARGRRRRRQHDGGDRHRQRDAGRAQHEPGYLRHAVRVRRAARWWTTQAGWAAFCSSTGGWLPLICTMNCTVATESVARAVRLRQPRRRAVMAGTAPGAGGLVHAAVLQRRTHAGPAARARPACHGMDSATSRAATPIARRWKARPTALRNGFDALRAAGLRFDAIRLTGGGSRSAAWRQMVADVFELPVEVPEQAEGAAFGAALQALWAHGRSNGVGDIAAIVGEHVQRESGAVGAAGSGRRRRLSRALPAVPPSLGQRPSSCTRTIGKPSFPDDRSVATAACLSLCNYQDSNTMNTPTSSAQRNTSPGSAESRSRAAIPTIRWHSRSTTPTSASR